MINNNDNFLMMSEPKSKKPEPTVNDKFSEMADFLLGKIEARGFYKGYHTCACGEGSDSAKSMLRNVQTNSLLSHYVKNHRSEVPIYELEKLEKIYNKFKPVAKLK